ncbi:MAG: hypothetical protein OEY14_14585 [Myxococcales bacterium]|nr:hypothetical protein [Myxococcales bacterium]
MRVGEDVVEAVATEVSMRMQEPTYAHVAVGSFVQAFPDLSRFLTAKTDALGGGEAVIHAVFHAEVLAECFRRATHAELASIGFVELDAAAGPDRLEALSELEPAIASYIASNIDAPPLRELLAHLGLALRAAAAPRSGA